MIVRSTALAVLASVLVTSTALAAKPSMVQQRLLMRKAKLASSSSSQRSSSSSSSISSTTAKQNSKSIFAPQPKTADDFKYNLEQIISSMTDTLAIMRKLDNAVYAYYGSDDENAKELDQIINAYGGLIGSLAISANNQKQAPLPEWEKQDVRRAVSMRKSLEEQYESIRKHLQCSIERTCSLLPS